MLLGKIDDSKPGRVSYVYDQYMFHYIVFNGIIYLCMTVDHFESSILTNELSLLVLLVQDLDPTGNDRVRLPYAFLDDVKTEFVNSYGDRAQVP